MLTAAAVRYHVVALLGPDVRAAVVGGDGVYVQS
jgi:hypothetical protein